MPSINVWQRVDRVLCCPWLALLLSCLRTGPVHRKISMLRPSQALLSYWPGRDLSTMQTKSLPTPSIIWRLKVRFKRKNHFNLFQVFSFDLKKDQLLTEIDEGVKRCEVTVNHNEVSYSLTYDHLSLVKAICCCSTEQRSRRTQNGNFAEITTGLASPLSAIQLILLAVKGPA